MNEKSFIGTGTERHHLDELEPAPEALVEEEDQDPGERIERGEVVQDPDYKPEQVEEIISRAVKEALQPLKESLDELVGNMPIPRHKIRERPFQNRPFSVIEQRDHGGPEEELGTFSHHEDAEHFVNFLQRGGWSGDGTDIQ